MISRSKLLACCSFLVVYLVAPHVSAQNKAPDPSAQATEQSSEAQDSLRVFTEEVRIPVTAYDENGFFDPTVELKDLMLKENGVAQQLQSIYRVPASVLLLLDTGGELNLAKNLRLTREAAISLVSGLQENDAVAVAQVNNRVELVQDWTTDRAAVIHSLRNKLLSGKRSVLAAGLLAAAEQLKTRPPGNRHLILISDGIDSEEDHGRFDDAIKTVIGANVTVHVISYTTLGLNAKKPKVTRPRVKSITPEDAVRATPRIRNRWPREPGPDLKEILEMRGSGTVVDLDRLFRRSKSIRKDLEQREEEFGALAEETGGGLWLPVSAEEMVLQARELAWEVDSQYVITYKPQRPLSSAAAGEYRKIDIISRRTGLKIRARHGYVDSR